MDNRSCGTQMSSTLGGKFNYVDKINIAEFSGPDLFLASLRHPFPLGHLFCLNPNPSFSVNQKSIFDFRANPTELVPVSNAVEMSSIFEIRDTLL